MFCCVVEAAIIVGALSWFAVVVCCGGLLCVMSCRLSPRMRSLLFRRKIFQQQVYPKLNILVFPILIAPFPIKSFGLLFPNNSFSYKGSSRLLESTGEAGFHNRGLPSPMPGQKHKELYAILNDQSQSMRNYNAFGAFHRCDGSKHIELQAFLNTPSKHARNYTVLCAFHLCDGSKHAELLAFLNTPSKHFILFWVHSIGVVAQILRNYKLFWHILTDARRVPERKSESFGESQTFSQSFSRRAILEYIAIVRVFCWDNLSCSASQACADLHSTLSKHNTILCLLRALGCRNVSGYVWEVGWPFWPITAFSKCEGRRSMCIRLCCDVLCCLVLCCAVLLSVVCCVVWCGVLRCAVPSLD